MEEMTMRSSVQVQVQARVQVLILLLVLCGTVAWTQEDGPAAGKTLSPYFLVKGARRAPRPFRSSPPRRASRSPV